MASNSNSTLLNKRPFDAQFRIALWLDSFHRRHTSSSSASSHTSTSLAAALQNGAWFHETETHNLPAAAPSALVNIAASAVLSLIPPVEPLSTCCLKQQCCSLQTYYGPHRPQGETLALHSLVRLQASQVKLFPFPSSATFLDDQCLCAARAMGAANSTLEHLHLYEYRQPSAVAALSGSIPYQGLRTVLLGPSQPPVEGLTVYRLTQPDDAAKLVEYLAEGVRQRQWKRLRVGDLPAKTNLVPLYKALLQHCDSKNTTRDEDTLDGEDAVMSGRRETTTTTTVQCPQWELEELELEVMDHVDSPSSIASTSLVRSPSLLTVTALLPCLRRLSLRGCRHFSRRNSLSWALLGTACGQSNTLCSVDLALCGLTDHNAVEQFLISFAMERWAPPHTQPTKPMDSQLLHFDFSHNQLTPVFLQLWLEHTSNNNNNNTPLQQLSLHVASLDISGNRFGTTTTTTEREVGVDPTAAGGSTSAVGLLCRLLSLHCPSLLRLRAECTEWSGTDSIKRIAKTWASSRKMDTTSPLGQHLLILQPQFLTTGGGRKCSLVPCPSHRFLTERYGGTDVELSFAGCPSMSSADWKAVLQATGDVAQQLYDASNTTTMLCSPSPVSAAVILYGQESLFDHNSSSSGSHTDTVSTKHSSSNSTKKGKSSSSTKKDSSSSASQPCLLFTKLGSVFQWVSWLDLRTCAMGHNGVLALSAALQSASGDGATPLPLQVLKLCDNGLKTPTPRQQKDSIPFLARCLRSAQCPHLRELHLSFNELSDHQPLLKLIEQTSGELHVLNLSGNEGLVYGLTGGTAAGAVLQPGTVDTRGHPKDFVAALSMAQQQRQNRIQQQQPPHCSRNNISQNYHCALWMKDCHITAAAAAKCSRFHVELVVE